MKYDWPAPEERFASRLQSLTKKSLYRRLQAPKGLDVSSNDYLGLARDDRVSKAMVSSLTAGLDVGSTGSRLLTGERRDLEAVECRFAQWQQQEAALYFASGYQANLGLMSSVIEAGDHVISDALNHASLIDGIRLSKARLSIIDHLDSHQMEQVLQSNEGPHWIVTESVYSMDGDLAPIESYARLAKKYGAGLLVDEAHATGLYGPQGQGRVAALGLQKDVVATVHTCGKAMGLAGAFVTGSKNLRSLLVNQARSFIYSTGPLPVIAPALEASIEVICNDPARRQQPIQMAQRLRDRLIEGGFEVGGGGAIVPVILGSSSRAIAVAEALQHRGYDVRAIRPPTVPEGTARLRLVTGGHLKHTDIDRLASDILDILESL
ncbi:MAG TPA: 8-amino-7-oxononanoate synthase [Myxococcales bacterium]|nr:8-amino-7-oxononanoate synthase [Myxococcales bacterium]